MKCSQQKLTDFCTALAETCNVGLSAKSIGVSRKTVYRWRRECPGFAEEWDKALCIAVSMLEDEAHRRAFDGTLEPVFHQGVECGTIRKYSDSLAMFLLKAHNPAKYRENTRMELTGANGGPVRFTDTERAAKIAAILSSAEVRRDDDDNGII